MLTDVGFILEVQGGTQRCYWFGQVDRIEVRRSKAGPRNEPVREIVAWLKDNSRALVLLATEANPGNLPELETAIVSAHQAWMSKYPDVAASLNFSSFSRITSQLNPVLGSSWYDQRQKTVACSVVRTLL